MKKKLLAGLLAGVAALGLISCSSAGNKKNDYDWEDFQRDKAALPDYYELEDDCDAFAILIHDYAVKYDKNEDGKYQKTDADYYNSDTTCLAELDEEGTPVITKHSDKHVYRMNFSGIYTVSGEHAYCQTFDVWYDEKRIVRFYKIANEDAFEPTGGFILDTNDFACTATLDYENHVLTPVTHSHNDDLYRYRDEKLRDRKFYFADEEEDPCCNVYIYDEYTGYHLVLVYQKTNKYYYSNSFYDMENTGNYPEAVLDVETGLITLKK